MKKAIYETIKNNTLDTYHRKISRKTLEYRDKKRAIYRGERLEASDARRAIREHYPT